MIKKFLPNITFQNSFLIILVVNSIVSLLISSFSCFLLLSFYTTIAFIIFKHTNYQVDIKYILFVYIILIFMYLIIYFNYINVNGIPYNGNLNDDRVNELTARYFIDNTGKERVDGAERPSTLNQVWSIRLAVASIPQSVNESA